jgi:Beta-lactamase
VVLLDAANTVAEKRGAQIGLMLGKLLPKGGARESFAGKQARELDGGRIAALLEFVEDAEKATDVPGVAFGVIQHGKVVYEGGVGVRQRGKPAKVDADTKVLIASTTKALDGTLWHNRTSAKDPNLLARAIGTSNARSAQHRSRAEPSSGSSGRMGGGDHERAFKQATQAGMGGGHDGARRSVVRGALRLARR